MTVTPSSSWTRTISTGGTPLLQLSESARLRPLYYRVAAVREHKGTADWYQARYQVLNSGTIALAPARNGS